MTVFYENFDSITPPTVPSTFNEPDGGGYFVTTNTVNIMSSANSLAYFATLNAITQINTVASGIGTDCILCCGFQYKFNNLQDDFIFKIKRQSDQRSLAFALSLGQGDGANAGASLLSGGDDTYGTPIALSTKLFSYSTMSPDTPYRIFVSSISDNFYAEVQRITDGNWLQPDATWDITRASILNATQTSIVTGGQAAILIYLPAAFGYWDSFLYCNATDFLVIESFSVTNNTYKITFQIGTGPIQGTAISNFIISGFTGGAVSINTSSVTSETTIEGTLDRTIDPSETGGIVSYVPGNITDSNSTTNSLNAFINFPVLNLTPDITAPTIDSHSINCDRLLVKFVEASKNIYPKHNSKKPIISATGGAIALITWEIGGIYGCGRLSRPLAKGETYTLSYTDPNDETSIQDSSANHLGNVSNMSGTNKSPGTYDSNGFTVLTAAADTVYIYVSSISGNDSNDGSTINLPVKTVDKAMTLAAGVSNHPCWVLLKRGERFDGFVSNAFNVSNSSDNYSLLGTYGTGDRPLFTGTHDFSIQGSKIAIIGIDFYNNLADPNSSDYATGNDAYIGFQYFNTYTDILIEDCAFSYWGTGIDIQGSTDLLTDIVIRFNIVTNSYCTTGAFTQGIYISATLGAILENLTINHCGWVGNDRDNPTISGGNPREFNHGIYYAAGSQALLVNGLISCNNAAHGAEFRSGALLENAIFVGNAVGVLFGYDPSIPSYINYANNWVIQKSVDIDSENPLAWGLNINSNVFGATFENGVVAHSAIGEQSIALQTGSSNVTIKNINIYDWNNRDVTDGGFNTTRTNVTLNGIGYNNPNLTLGNYYASIGGSNSDDDYITYLISRPIATWNSTYDMKNTVNYILNGFTFPSSVIFMNAYIGIRSSGISIIPDQITNISVNVLG